MITTEERAMSYAHGHVIPALSALGAAVAGLTVVREAGMFMWHMHGAHTSSVSVTGQAGGELCRVYLPDLSRTPRETLYILRAFMSGIEFGVNARTVLRRAAETTGEER